jgi:hypothetical protein
MKYTVYIYNIREKICLLITTFFYFVSLLSFYVSQKSKLNLRLFFNIVVCLNNNYNYLHLFTYYIYYKSSMDLRTIYMDLFY